MARNASAAQAATNREMPAYNGDYKLEHVKWGKDNKYCRFTLALPFGISLYGCRLIYGKDGKGYIVPASDKGQDNKYYPRYFLRLVDDLQEKIIKELEAF